MILPIAHRCQQLIDAVDQCFQRVKTKRFEIVYKKPHIVIEELTASLSSESKIIPVQHKSTVVAFICDDPMTELSKVLSWAISENQAVENCVIQQMKYKSKVILTLKNGNT